MQSELLPSACRVELPSKPHIGSCSSVGKTSNSSILVLPRRFGTGSCPSSQMYSSLYFAMLATLSSSDHRKRPRALTPVTERVLEASSPRAADRGGSTPRYSQPARGAQAEAAAAPPQGELESGDFH